MERSARTPWVAALCLSLLVASFLVIGGAPALAASPPTITSITPSSGPTAGGTVVTVRGTNLTGATNAVFGSTRATGGTAVSATELRLTAPAHTAGSVDIRVTTAGGTSTAVAADRFTYVATPKPTVTAISPSRGPTSGGTVVTLTGTNLTGATKVVFGTSTATGVTAISATSLQVTSPARAAGTVDIQVTTAGGTSSKVAADRYTYVTTTDTTPPGAVTGVTASATTNTSITVSWTKPPDADLTGIVIRRATGTTAPATPTAGTAVADTSATTFTDTGLTANTTYSYALFAHDAVPNYASAAKVTATTRVCTPAVQRVSGAITADTTWSPACTSAYVLDSTVTIASGKTLTIAAGAVVKAVAGTSLAVTGTLVVAGTGAAPVTFTSAADDMAGGDTNGNGGATAPAAADWGGIKVGDRASAILDFAVVRYGGIAGESAVSASNSQTIRIRHGAVSDSRGSGITVWVDRSGQNSGSAAVEISDSTVNRVASVGIAVSATGVPDGSGTQIPMPVVANNTVTGAGDAAIVVSGDALDGAQLRGNSGTGNAINTIGLTGTLTTSLDVPLGGLALGIAARGWTDQLRVAPGATMTVAAGGVVKSAGGGLLVEGTLNVNGTQASPATFTSLFDDSVGGDAGGGASSPAAGDWNGITVGDRASATFDYASVRYSAGVSASNSLVFRFRHGSVSDSSFDAIGAAVDRSEPNAGGATVEVTDTRVTNANGVGIRVSATGTVAQGTQIPVPVVSGNVVTGAGDVAISVDGDALDGSRLLSNTGSDNLIDDMQIGGTLATDLAVPFGGLPLGLGTYWSSQLTVAPGATMSIAAGSVIKSLGGGLLVNGVLNSTGADGAPVTFTSLRDDSVGGDTNGDLSATTPPPATGTV